MVSALLQREANVDAATKVSIMGSGLSVSPAWFYKGSTLSKNKGIVLMGCSSAPLSVHPRGVEHMPLELMNLASPFTERKHSLTHRIFGWASGGDQGLGYKWSECQCTISGKPATVLQRTFALVYQ